MTWHSASCFGHWYVRLPVCVTRFLWLPILMGTLLPAPFFSALLGLVHTGPCRFKGPTWLFMSLFFLPASCPDSVPVYRYDQTLPALNHCPFDHEYCLTFLYCILAVATGDCAEGSDLGASCSQNFLTGVKSIDQILNRLRQMHVQPNELTICLQVGLITHHKDYKWKPDARELKFECNSKETE